MQSITYYTTELSENLWKGWEILRISYNAYSIYKNSNLGTLPMQFSGNFIEQSLKSYEWKRFCYSIRKYFWTNVEVRDVGMD